MMLHLSSEESVLVQPLHIVLYTGEVCSKGLKNNDHPLNIGHISITLTFGECVRGGGGAERERESQGQRRKGSNSYSPCSIFSLFLSVIPREFLINPHKTLLYLFLSLMVKYINSSYLKSIIFNAWLSCWLTVGFGKDWLIPHADIKYNRTSN